MQSCIESLADMQAKQESRPKRLKHGDSTDDGDLSIVIEELHTAGAPNSRKRSIEGFVRGMDAYVHLVRGLIAARSHLTQVICRGPCSVCFELRHYVPNGRPVCNNCECMRRS